MTKRKVKLYSSCEFLPLWNFFKVNENGQLNLKYLAVLSDRLDYSSFEITDEKILKECEVIWFNIFEEYNELDKNSKALNFLNEKSKILLFAARYQQESAIIMRLMYKTSPNYLAYLRSRGYKIDNTSQSGYAASLLRAFKRAQNHQTQIELLVKGMKKDQEENKQEKNPYDDIMAWILSNDIRVDENITVSRYLKVKEIIREKIKRQNKRNDGRA